MSLLMFSLVWVTLLAGAVAALATLISALSRAVSRGTTIRRELRDGSAVHELNVSWLRPDGEAALAEGHAGVVPVWPVPLRRLHRVGPAAAALPMAA